MSRYESFKYWVPILRKQFKNGNQKAKRAIKNNVYSNWNLTDKEKDKVWEEIVNE